MSFTLLFSFRQSLENYRWVRVSLREFTFWRESSLLIYPQGFSRRPTKEIGNESVHAFSLPSEQLTNKLMAMERSDKPTIIIKSGKTIRQIEITDLLYIECDSYVCTLVLSDGTQINCTKSLQYFEETLSPWRFERISRDAIVSLKHVMAIKSKNNNRKTVIMKDGKELDIAFRRWKQFKDAFYG